MKYTELLEAQTYDLQARYDHFNKLLFNGSLPRIPLTWKKLKHIGGKAHAGIEVDPSLPKPHPLMVRLGRADKYSNYRVKPGSMYIEISTLYQRSERAMDQIMVHEMIHIWCYTNGHLGAGHGPIFQEQIRRCSAILGFEVPLKDEVEGLEFAEPVAVKPFGVMLAEGPSRWMYCMMLPKTMQENLEYLKTRVRYLTHQRRTVSFYLIADKMWAEHAMVLPVQRSVKTIKWYHGDKPELLADLKQNGRLLAEVTP